METGALVRRNNFEVAAVNPSEAPRQGKTKASAGNSFRDPIVEALERCEHALNVPNRDPRTSIGDVDVKRVAFFARSEFPGTRRRLRTSPRC